MVVHITVNTYADIFFRDLALLLSRHGAGLKLYSDDTQFYLSSSHIDNTVG